VHFAHFVAFQNLLAVPTCISDHSCHPSVLPISPIEAAYHYHRGCPLVLPMPPTMTPPPKQPTKHHSPTLPLEMSTAAYHHCLTQQQYYTAEGASPCTRMLELSLTSLTFPWLTTLMRRFLTASRRCRTPSNWIRSVQSFVQPVSLFGELHTSQRLYCSRLL